MKRLLLLLLLLCGGIALAGENTMPVTNVHKAIVQPAQWLNTSRPLTAEDLQGRIILLDFWTYCCINCMHVIPDLHYLEEKFGDKLTVIGVHSAKFANERDSENIRSAILRYDIAHPVVNDAQFQVWKSFGVNSWPTFVLINPQGVVAEVYSGEGNREALEHDISTLIAKNTALNTAPLPIALEKNKEPQTVLKFPGKIIFIPEMKALAISDSGHNRIMIAGLDGQIREIIGSGEAGYKDGKFDVAEFNHPQGMAYENGYLYVADTDNHLIRKVEFGMCPAAVVCTAMPAPRVNTLSGTGVQGYERNPRNADALKTPLASPWDVAFYPDNNHLAIAMAGTHQIWSDDLHMGVLNVIAGTGRENIEDGPAPDAALAQTSGLSVFGGKLYFVDSETSSLRVLENGQVKTLIGSGLFDFGYKEGAKGAGQLQHPLGVFADDSGVYVADSYNHSIRKFDVASGKLNNFAGHGVRGNKDGALAEAEFNEPNGLTRVGNVLYIADTNNHRIRVIDMERSAVSTLDVREPSQAPALSDDLPNVEHLGKLRVALAGAQLHLALKPGWHINDEAPSYLVLYKGAKAVQQFTRAALQGKTVVLPMLEAGVEYRLQGTLYYCKETAGSQCQIKSIDAGLKAESGGKPMLTVKLE